MQKDPGVILEFQHETPSHKIYHTVLFLEPTHITFDILRNDGRKAQEKAL
jgi:hypothetical protein